METIIDIYCTTHSGKRIGLFRRTIKKPFVPVLNALLEDVAWKEPKRIKDITINPLGGYYMLTVENESYEDGNSESVIQSYKLHGWEKI